jgi:tetratricopeptide (TPR) repeat protein
MTRLSMRSIQERIVSNRFPRPRMAVCSLAILAATLAASIASAAPAVAGTPPPAPDSMASGLLGKSQAYLDMLDRYLTLMEKFARLTEDPAASGSAAVLSTREILTTDGDTKKAIEYFTQLLPEVKNESVQRTIHIELSELYKHDGQKDKALEQLRILMTSAPPAPPEPAAHHEGHTPLSDAATAQHP